jgi:gas vesicle protein
MIMARQDNGITIAWFLVGAAVGAAIALLYAPQSGKDTRRLIAQKTEESKDAILDSSKDVLDKGKELFDRGRELADEAADIFERGRKLVRG